LANSTASTTNTMTAAVCCLNLYTCITHSGTFWNVQQCMLQSPGPPHLTTRVQHQINMSVGHQNRTSKSQAACPSGQQQQLTMQVSKHYTCSATHAKAKCRCYRIKG
jgi:hypothetical protein